MATPRPYPVPAVVRAELRARSQTGEGSVERYFRGAPMRSVTAARIEAALTSMGLGHLQRPASTPTTPRPPEGRPGHPLAAKPRMPRGTP